jgi:hypothetical protein
MVLQRPIESTKPIGQIQAAERMIHANAYSTRMAKALLTITKPELLVTPEKVSRSSPGSGAKLEVLQQESEALLIDLKKVEESYATQALDLTLWASDTWSVCWLILVLRVPSKTS